MKDGKADKINHEKKINTIGNPPALPEDPNGLTFAGAQKNFKPGNAR
jgi:hypothetical protein